MKMENVTLQKHLISYNATFKTVKMLYKYSNELLVCYWLVKRRANQ